MAGSLSLRSPSAHLNNLLCGVASNYGLGGIFQPQQNGTKSFDKDAAKAVDSKLMSQVLNKCHVEGPVYSRCGEVLNKQGAAGLGVFCTMWGRHDDRWCHTGHTLQTTVWPHSTLQCNGSLLLNKRGVCLRLQQSFQPQHCCPLELKKLPTTTPAQAVRCLHPCANQPAYLHNLTQLDRMVAGLEGQG